MIDIFDIKWKILSPLALEHRKNPERTAALQKQHDVNNTDRKPCGSCTRKSATKVEDSNSSK